VPGEGLDDPRSAPHRAHRTRSARLSAGDLGPDRKPTAKRKCSTRIEHDADIRGITQATP
jgi:hypothetical protein